MLGCCSYDVKYLIQGFERYLLMKEVAHRVYEDPPWFFPFQWLPKHRVMDMDFVGPPSVRWQAHLL